MYYIASTYKVITINNNDFATVFDCLLQMKVVNVSASMSYSTSFSSHISSSMKLNFHEMYLSKLQQGITHLIIQKPFMPITICLMELVNVLMNKIIVNSSKWIPLMNRGLYVSVKYVIP